MTFCAFVGGPWNGQFVEIPDDKDVVVVPLSVRAYPFGRYPAGVLESVIYRRRRYIAVDDDRRLEFTWTDFQPGE